MSDTTAAQSLSSGGEGCDSEPPVIVVAEDCREPVTKPDSADELRQKLEADESVVDWLLERGTESYRAEVERTQKLRDRLQFFSSTLLTPVLGAMIYLVTTFKPGHQLVLNYAFAACIALAAGLILTALVWVALFFMTSDLYATACDPQGLWKERQDLIDRKSARLLRDLKYGFAENLAMTQAVRAKQNSAKLRAVLNAQKMTFLAVPMLMLAVPFYLLGAFSDPPVTRVEWVTPSLP